uniref:Uncharacterized protein n=1 Tax=Helicotheca tamesis TaxID=374047 RepID=A0A7S2I361_9STRA|mmetsp:Transcript_5251/g.7186  ORF Transcript_5251/g.7186 Transcript_5251/m.7186 type:complete len:372 (+) Transcript_5251:80-1195(+)|eukprot:CAMPEP_0185726736 /NCGR_PEP_ID=MMETSP1171-20130828/2609_1 /TAXON_ID=374046 /ORGANISM="Helicotheca tamensis, Strain CCMP826" /LENGTH=371 /DNA_ID=CAMNT_0028395133 /DNA_START=57 /DNA_END=1172 /DNA_ORIENTATION=+
MSRSATLLLDDHNGSSENCTVLEAGGNMAQEPELCNILDPFQGNKSKRRKLDEEAIKRSVQQNPNAANKEYTFENRLYRQTCYPLHASIILGWSMDVIKLLYSAFPQAIQKKCQIYNQNQTPLHLACAFRPSSPDIVSFLLQTYPSAVHQSDPSDGLLPLHTACLNRASPDIISLLIEKGPMALREKTIFGGSTPLHIACAESLPIESLSLLLQQWPGATREKTCRGQLPLHHACYRCCSVDKIQLLLETYPRAVFGRDWEGRTPLDCKFIPKETSDLLKIIYSLLDDSILKKERHAIATECLNTFIQMKWWGGAAIVLDACPTVKLSVLDDCVKIAPYLLSFVGKRCRLSTMQKLICNRQDLLLVDGLSS